MQCQAFEIQPAESRLILALVLSLALHLALAFLVQVKPVGRFDARTRVLRVLQVNLAKRLTADSQRLEEKSSSSPRQKPQQPAAPKQIQATAVPPGKLRLKPAPPPFAPEQDMLPPPSLPTTESRPIEAPANYTAPPPPAPVQTIPSPQSPLPTVDIPLIEDPTYYTAKQVDIHPLAAEPITPEFPEAAAAAGIEGFVTLRLLIDATGMVREISVVDAQPPDTFEAAALNAFRNARFVAAQRNDRPVKSDVLIKVMFEIIAGTQKLEARD